MQKFKGHFVRAFFTLLILSGLLAAADGYAIALNPTSPLVQPPPTPLGGQPAHQLGGTYRCAWWTLVLPAGVLPYSSTVHCPPYNPQTTQPAPDGFALLGRSITLNLYNNDGRLLTTFNPSLGLCYKYAQADLDLAGDPKNFVIHRTLQIDGKWEELPTTTDLQARQVCAAIDRAALIDLAVRITPKAPATTASQPTRAVAVPTPSSSTTSTYIVKQSDTLYSIARRYGVTVQMIQAVNNLRTVDLYVGQTLVIPSANAPAPALVAPTATAAAPAVGNTVPAPSPAPVITGKRRVPALEYHYSSFKLSERTMMTPQWFESQMKWLHDNNYYALSANEFSAYLNGAYNPPARAVMLTFDLGTPNFDDFTNVIVPTLRKYKLRGMFFLVLTMTSEECVNGYACWSRLREWQAEGLISVQSHGMTHPDYAKSTAQQIQYDAQQAKYLLETKLGTPVLGFAYPFDSAPANAQSIVQAAGYKFAMSGNTRGDKSIAPFDSMPFNLPRYYPYSGIGTYPVIYGTTLTFEQMLLGAVQ